ncbi:hypothetical protein GM415_04340 [Pseudodesulfovibrio cashew]|uniref:Aminoglycoside phosphotransferase domain-containing protein n=1 Tax=Pseudodesulfovibrio cashew TaxID=2678688 RepID=A0A6I6JBD4_9BACT|nr:phosphotransferase [Pseudodesulfovibrio cashew]QGY39381.1 hypothetical protein GM415_04340 [Pseudodesulfovibrio cashew]
MPKRTPYVDTAFFDLPPGTEASPLGGGRNSQVFLVQPPGRDPMVFKRYFVDPSDKRDRQATEALALRFLERSGVESAPRLLTLDTDRQVSMLAYVEGTKVTEPTSRDMDLAAEFLLRLIRLSTTDEAREAGFSPASEAFFSVTGILENIETRLARLEGVTEECPLCRELSDFLAERLRPAIVTYARRCRERLESAGMTVDREIPEEWRILSPSDFGLHNAVKRPDGGLSFFDYEYFGWDDPSKTLADFCLHPAMNLADALQHRFLSTVVPELESLGYNRDRGVALFPLFGIKWCCILLNEFVPREAARRSFARIERTESETRVLTRQLDKARAMLDSLDDRTETFARQMAGI